MGGVAADVTNIGRQLGRYLRPLEKWGGGGGKKKKQNKTKHLCKGEGKEKKFM